MSYLAYIHKGHEEFARRYFVERAAIVQDAVLSGGLVLAIMCTESFVEELKINPPSWLRAFEPNIVLRTAK